MIKRSFMVYKNPLIKALIFLGSGSVALVRGYPYISMMKNTEGPSLRSLQTYKMDVVFIGDDNEKDKASRCSKCYSVKSCGCMGRFVCECFV